VVYMERLDTWRVDNSDRAIFLALKEHFGMEMWDRTVLGRGLRSFTSQLNLTRSGHTSPCPPV